MSHKVMHIDQYDKRQSYEQNNKTRFGLAWELSHKPTKKNKVGKQVYPRVYVLQSVSS